MRGKRGVEQEVYFLIFEVIIVILVLAVLVNWVNSIKDDTFFEKNYISKDISLLVDSVLAAPGNVGYNYLSYTANISKFDYEMKKGAFIVKEAREGSPLYFYYAEDRLRGGTLQGVLNSPEQLQFSLNGEIFEFGADLTPLAGKLVCRGVETNDSSWKEKEIAIVADTGSDSDFKWQLEKDVDFYKDAKGAKLSSNSNNPSFIIKIAKNDKTNGTIKAYVNNGIYLDKSSKLACLVVNKFYDSYKDSIKGSVIIPTDSKMPEINGVLLEISSDLVVQNNPHIDLIYQGIEEYFTK